MERGIKGGRRFFGGGSFVPTLSLPAQSPKSRDCDSETMREKRGGKRHFSPGNRDRERTETDGRV